MRIIVLAILALTVTGCDEVVVATPGPSTTAPKTAAAPKVSASRAAHNFTTVVARMEPVAERECRARRKDSRVNCDFKIVVDNRKGQPPNAFQTLDKSGRPVIAFTSALIREARNQDEIAFILGHEASHHIRGHIPKVRQSAIAGAVVGGLLASVLGAEPAAIQSAQRLGGTVGARRFSKGFELQADELGTIITARSGYNPIRGAAYFNRIRDPGNRFLGSHPPNAARIETVRRTVANMRR